MHGYQDKTNYMTVSIIEAATGKVLQEYVLDTLNALSHFGVDGVLTENTVIVGVAHKNGAFYFNQVFELGITTQSSKSVTQTFSSSPVSSLKIAIDPTAMTNVFLFLNIGIHGLVAVYKCDLAAGTITNTNTAIPAVQKMYTVQSPEYIIILYSTPRATGLTAYILGSDGKKVGSFPITLDGGNFLPNDLQCKFHSAKKYGCLSIPYGGQASYFVFTFDSKETEGKVTWMRTSYKSKAFMATSEPARYYVYGSFNDQYAILFSSTGPTDIFDYQNGDGYAWASYMPENSHIDLTPKGLQLGPISISPSRNHAVVNVGGGNHWIYTAAGPDTYKLRSLQPMQITFNEDLTNLNSDGVKLVINDDNAPVNIEIWKIFAKQNFEPKPDDGSDGGGFKWWMMLLIILAILIIAGVAFFLYKKRKDAKNVGDIYYDNSEPFMNSQDPKNKKNDDEDDV